MLLTSVLLSAAQGALVPDPADAPRTEVTAPSSPALDSATLRLVLTDRARAVFAADEVRRALGSQDLALREQAFESVVERSRWDLAARAFLEELACSPELELRWTARMALRELQRPPGIDVHLGTPIAFGGREVTLQIAEQLERELGRYLNPSLAFLAEPPPGTSASPSLGAQVGELTGGAKSMPVVIPGLGLSDSTASKTETERPQEDAGQILRRLPVDEPEPAQGVRARVSVEGVWMTGPQGSFYMAKVRTAPRAEIPLDRLGVQVSEVLPSGLLLYSVLPGTLAEALGLHPGDVLVELCGMALREPDDIGLALAQRPPNAPLTMRCLERGLIQRSAVWAAPGVPGVPAAGDRRVGGAGAR